jgi:hypothetical protein
MHLTAFFGVNEGMEVYHWGIKETAEGAGDRFRWPRRPPRPWAVLRRDLAAYFRGATLMGYAIERARGLARLVAPGRPHPGGLQQQRAMVMGADLCVDARCTPANDCAISRF